MTSIVSTHGVLDQILPMAPLRTAGDHSVLDRGHATPRQYTGSVRCHLLLIVSLTLGRAVCGAQP